MMIASRVPIRKVTRAITPIATSSARSGRTGHVRQRPPLRAEKQSGSTEEGPGRNGKLEANELALLSNQELEIVLRIAGGYSNKDLAAELGLSKQSLRRHLANLFEKLGVSNRLELALYAVHHHVAS